MKFNEIKGEAEQILKVQGKGELEWLDPEEVHGYTNVNWKKEVCNWLIVLVGAALLVLLLLSL